MLSVLKPLSEKALQPVAHLLRNVNPNTLSLLSLVFPVLFFVLVLQGHYWWALIAFICSAVDMLDGLVARAQNKVTPFGGFLDSTIDRFADFTVIAAFAFSDIVSWAIVAPLLMLTYLISYIRSRTELAAKGTLVASVGLIERTERYIIIFVGLLAYAIWPHLSLLELNSAGIAFVLLAILSAITVGQRVVFAYRKL